VRRFSIQRRNKSVTDPIKRAETLVQKAEGRGIRLRLMGHGAIRIHSPRYSYLFESLKREITDLDFVSYSKSKDVLIKFFEEEGIQSDREMRMLMTVLGRYKFRDPETNFLVDVFFDKLVMNHTINFSNRLELDSPTLPLTDLLLGKTQIVKLNEKDVKDIIVLLLEHEVGDGDRDQIDAKYLSHLLGNDWGFYYTVTSNLRSIRDEFMEMYPQINNRDIVTSRIDTMLSTIENQPKSFRWRMRSRIGTSQKWYTQVDDN
jgi:hypothetical protein